MTRSKHIYRHLVHLWEDVPLEADMLFWVKLIKIDLKLVKWQLVAWLKFAIVFAPFLHSVVGQVNKAVVQIMHWILATWCSKVALFVQISLEVSVLSRHQSKCTNVKLTAVDEERVVDVLLKDASPLNPISSIFYYILNLLKLFSDLNSLPLIRVFTWFDDPNVLGCHLGVVVFLLFLLVFDLLSGLFDLFWFL